LHQRLLLSVLLDDGDAPHKVGRLYRTTWASAPCVGVGTTRLRLLVQDDAAIVAVAAVIVCSWSNRSSSCTSHAVCVRDDDDCQKVPGGGPLFFPPSLPVEVASLAEASWREHHHDGGRAISCAHIRHQFGSILQVVSPWPAVVVAAVGFQQSTKMATTTTGTVDVVVADICFVSLLTYFSDRAKDYLNRLVGINGAWPGGGC
jgi:hypothetical protein